jgi:hypothetical protein
MPRHTSHTRAASNEEAIQWPKSGSTIGNQRRYAHVSIEIQTCFSLLHLLPMSGLVYRCTQNPSVPVAQVFFPVLTAYAQLKK